MAAEVVEGAETSAVFEDEVDHLGRDAEVGKHEHRYVGGHRLQGRGRRHRDQRVRALQSVGHGARGEPDRAGGNAPLGDQLVPQLRVGPQLTVRLLLTVRSAELDHRPARVVGQRQQHLPSLLPGRRHLGLSREDDIAALSRADDIAVRGPGGLACVTLPEERQPR